MLKLNNVFSTDIFVVVIITLLDCVSGFLLLLISSLVVRYFQNTSHNVKLERKNGALCVD